MAPDLARHLAPGGHAVLAGLLTSQRRPLLARHRAFGLHLLEAREYGEWSTLVLGKCRAPAIFDRRSAPCSRI